MRHEDDDERHLVRVRNLALLRNVRAATGRTQREAASASGIHWSTLANIEAGRRGCSTDIAERICQTYGVPVHLLFADDIADDTTYIAQGRGA